MALVIDIGKFIHGEKPTTVDTTNAEATPPIDATPDRKVDITREAFDACKHREMEINEKQRTVKCAACGMWLDPVWCLTELFRYYETRIDQRLEIIREHDEREKAARERKARRKQQPRRHLIQRRAETAERAAYNEYQAKILAARAERQRQLVSKLDAEIESAG